MRSLLVFLLAFTARCFGGNPWPGVEFSEVRAYAWPQEAVVEAVVQEGMQPRPGAVNPVGNRLSAEQTSALLKAMNRAGEGTQHPKAACHVPHHAFIFYDAKRTPVAYVEVCFECLTHRVFPEGAAEYPDLKEMALLLHSMKLPLGKYESPAAFGEHLARVRALLAE